MARTERTAIRMTPELKKRLEKLAEKDRRSLSSFLEFHLAELADRLEKSQKRRG